MPDSFWKNSRLFEDISGFCGLLSSVLLVSPSVLSGLSPSSWCTHTSCRTGIQLSCEPTEPDSSSVKWGQGQWLLSLVQPANSCPCPQSPEDPTLHLRVQLGELHTKSPATLALACVPAPFLASAERAPAVLSSTAYPPPSPPHLTYSFPTPLRLSVHPLGEGEGGAGFELFFQERNQPSYG